MSSIRVIAGIVAGAALAAVVTGTAAGATGYTWFTPERAAPGDMVQVAVDVYNCEGGWDQPTLRMRLDTDFDGIGTETTLVNVGEPGRFRFTVPDMAPGEYHVSLECSPGDWLGVSSNGGDGAPGDPRFTVLAGNPDTSTAAGGVELPQSASDGWWQASDMLVGIVFVAVVFGAIGAVFRRTRPAA